MLKLKTGVRLLGVKPETVLAINITQSVYQAYGFECVITSLTEGRHSRGSRHYSGYGFDTRTRHLGDKKQAVYEAVRAALGQDFDVVLEPTHMHIEYDPKTGVNT